MKYGLPSLAVVVLLAPPAGAADRPPATSQPAEFDIVQVRQPTAEEIGEVGGGGYAFDRFLKSGLPNAIPVPRKTPFDDNRERRAYYRKGYLRGFVTKLIGEWLFSASNEEFDPKSAYDRGQVDGGTAGGRLYELRRESVSRRRARFRYTENGMDGHKVTPSSPQAEQRVLARFEAFSAAMVTALAEEYPKGMSIAPIGPPTVYSYENDDYSRDNSGIPRRLRCYLGMFEKHPSAVNGLLVRSKDAAKATADEQELEGIYNLAFAYEPATGRWAFDADRPMWSFKPADPSAWSFTGFSSELAEKMIRKAVDAANARTERAPTRPASTRPAP